MVVSKCRVVPGLSGQAANFCNVSMARFLVTGGTGFIGSALLPRLVDAGHEVVVFTRRPDKFAGQFGNAVSFIDSFDAVSGETCFQAVINLAGEGIGDKRWSEKRKQQLLDSRINTTRDLVSCLARLQALPEVMISGSAVGWYGAQGEKPLKEEDDYVKEFSHAICQQWEEAAAEVKDLGVRLCIVRLGVVLERGGGIIKKLLPPFKCGLGGPISSGQQMMSWIHMNDVINAFNFLINNSQLDGIFNLAAPAAVDSKTFSRALGRAISRPAFLPLPGFMVKLLFGEMGDRLLLHGQNVVPARLLDNGFEFEYPDIEAAFAGVFPK